MTVQRIYLTGLLFVAGLLLTTGAAGAALKSTKVERYDVAVAKAVSFLRSIPALEERETSLVAYALLKAGVPPSEPRLLSGIADAQRRSSGDYDDYQGLYLAAVDAMLLADTDRTIYRRELQRIANSIARRQRADGSWCSPERGVNAPGDASLTQYCVLGLWAARRAGCRVDPALFDKAAIHLINHRNTDGGWSYRLIGPAASGSQDKYEQSTHNMTLASIGTIAVARWLLFPGEQERKPKTRFGGVLIRDDTYDGVVGYPDYNATVRPDAISAAIESGQQWNRVRFSPIPPAPFQLYFYYTLERAAALTKMEGDWFTTYGDGLLTLQEADGRFRGTNGAAVGTSFAVLYYMRSTQQILDYGKGLQTGNRDLYAFIYGDPKGKQKQATPLDQLLERMTDVDVSDVNVDTEEVVEKIRFSSREELIGEADKLRTMLKSPDAADRQIAYWALSRTADFDLIPLMLDGIHDPVLSVSVEALTGLRYIARKPNGFGLTLDPLGELPEDADQATKLNAVRLWKEKASNVWRGWYSGVRPYADRDGLDELGLPLDDGDR